MGQRKDDTMSFKQMREAREEAYGRKVPGIRAFFSFWCPLIAVVYISNIVDYVTDWNGNSVGFVFDLLICFLALASAIMGRFWEKEAFIAALCFLSAFFIRITWNFVSMMKSVGDIYSSMNSEVSSITTGGIEGMITSAASAGLGLGAGLMMIVSIISFIIYALFIGGYAAIFIKHRELFLMDEDLKNGSDGIY